MTTVAEKYLQIAKLAKDPANAEVVIDGILTFFGLDYFDLDLGVEYLYTTKVIDHKFRSVLHRAEDMDAIMAWFKEKTGVTDEESLEEYINIAVESGVHYLGFNFPKDVCNDCGTTGVFDFCPKCKSKNITRIRRVSGYLEILEGFTKGKKAEESKRRKHRRYDLVF